MPTNTEHGKSAKYYLPNPQESVKTKKTNLNYEHIPIPLASSAVKGPVSRVFLVSAIAS